MIPETTDPVLPMTGRGVEQDEGSQPPMVITGIETVPLRIPYKPGRRSAASVWGPAGPSTVDSLLVKVTTDQGWEGWGEAFGFTGAPVTQRAIDHLIAPLCIGKDATRVAPLMHEVQDRLQVFRGGPVTLALSAVDIALWDIVGKAAGAPLHRLLGGGVSDLPCYASMDAFSDPSLVRAGVQQALDAGFTSLKLHEKDLATVRAAREQAGPDTEIMLDVNCAWTVNQVHGLADELRDVRLKWLEEPVWPPETTTASPGTCRSCRSHRRRRECLDGDGLRASAELPVGGLRPAESSQNGRGNRDVQGVPDRGSPQRPRGAP